MSLYAFNMPLPEALPGWQDVLSCPFCLDVAIECVRLPHAEQNLDCGACACVECVKEWLVACETSDLTCPRCRYPICAVHLKEVCGRPNPRDPLIARLIGDVAAECPYCEVKGTVSTMVGHAAGHRVERFLESLHNTYSALRQTVVAPDYTPWVNTVVAMHAVAPSEACQYLVRWMGAAFAAGGEFGPNDRNTPLRALFVHLPVDTLDVCEIAWKNGAPHFRVGVVMDLYYAMTESHAAMEVRGCYDQDWAKWCPILATTPCTLGC